TPNKDGLWRSPSNNYIFLQSQTNQEVFCLATTGNGGIHAFWGGYSDSQCLDAGDISTSGSGYCLHIQFFSSSEARLYLADRTGGRTDSCNLCQESAAAVGVANDGMWHSASKYLPYVCLQHYFGNGALLVLTTGGQDFEIFYGHDVADGSFQGRSIYPNPDAE
ncbi:MAG: hypothetical protein HQK59_01280, partial [Deltaproteobacteria bacterium]|nr:hypothetical protein [Deltaproteobacteria bacterium]